MSFDFEPAAACARRAAAAAGDRTTHTADADHHDNRAV
jgi:hypothetical protein